ISDISSSKRSIGIWRIWLLVMMLSTGLTLPVTNSMGTCLFCSRYCLRIPLSLTFNSATVCSYGAKKISQFRSISFLDSAITTRELDGSWFSCQFQPTLLCHLRRPNLWHLTLILPYFLL